MSKRRRKETPEERARRLRVQKAVGEQLRLTRLLRRDEANNKDAWSQQAVADRIGISQSLYNRMEAGTARLDAYYLLLLADLVYDRPMTHFFTEAHLDVGSRYPTLSEEQIEREKARILDEIRRKEKSKHTSED